MRKVLFLFILVLFVASCQQQPQTEASADAKSNETSEMDEKSLLEKADPAGEYGKGVAVTEATDIAAILAEPEAFEGKTVLVKGEVAEVCAMRGCWMDVASGAEKIRIKVRDGDIVFPLSAVGHEAAVEGMVERLDLSREKAVEWLAHEAEEKGEAFDSTSVTGPLTIWRIKGAGAVIQAKS